MKLGSQETSIPRCSQSFLRGAGETKVSARSRVKHIIGSERTVLKEKGEGRNSTAFQRHQHGVCLRGCRMFKCHCSSIYMLDKLKRQYKGPNLPTRLIFLLTHWPSLEKTSAGFFRRHCKYI